MLKILYLLQIQEAEGSIYRNFYFESKEAMNKTITAIEVHQHHYYEDLDMLEQKKIKVNAYRTFAQIDRKRFDSLSLQYT